MFKKESEEMSDLADEAFKIGELAGGDGHMVDTVNNGGAGDGEYERMLQLLKSLKQSILCFL